MAFSQTDLDNINAAIATGEMTVEFNGRRVTYRSIAELKEARSIVASDLAAATNTGAGGGVRRGSYRVNFQTLRGD